jgi:hypothetical protein
MFLFIDAVKRLLDDDHGAPVNNKETLQKLLRRYRVNQYQKKLKTKIFICLGFASGCIESSTNN